MAGDEQQQLPVDIIYNILSRMPLKSLARFRCVSKVWYKYINDPYLEIMHKQRVIEDPRMLIIFELFPYPDVPISYILKNNSSIFKSALKEINLVTEEEDEDVMTVAAAYMKLWCIPSSCKYKLGDFVLAGSCKGLLLYSPQTYLYGKALHVINPLKRECYKVPPIKIGTCRSIGLGFDYSTNTLKIVCVVIRPPKIESLMRSNQFDDLIKEGLCCTMVHDVLVGTDNSSWRELALVPPYAITHDGVFANGCLHWLGYGQVVRKLILFDMTKEEFGSIDAPPSYTSTIYDMEHLVDLDGQVGLVCYDHNSWCIKVWKLTKSSCWVIHCCFEKNPPLPYKNQLNDIKVIGCLNKDGDLLITDRLLRKRLFIYNLKDGLLREDDNLINRQKGNRTSIQVYQNTFYSMLHSINQLPPIDDDDLS